MTLRQILPALLLGLALGLPADTVKAEPSVQEKNKAIVLEFFRVVFEGQNAEAAEKYIVEDYIQHNPNLPNGRAPLLKMLKSMWPQPKPAQDTMRNPPVLLVAEGDVVIAVFKTPRPDPADPTKTYDSFGFEAIRLKDGKFVEHWDGGLKAPPKATAQ